MILPLEISKWPPKWRELYEERAGMIEYDARLPRVVAESLAAQDIRKQAEKEAA